MVTDHQGREQHADRLVDFTALIRQLFWVGVVMGGVAVAGAVIQGLLDGLTFGVLVQWGTVWLLVMVGTAAVLVTMHALGGAGRARRRGERLSSDDVGALPVLPGRPRDAPAGDIPEGDIPERDIPERDARERDH